MKCHRLRKHLIIESRRVLHAMLLGREPIVIYRLRPCPSITPVNGCCWLEGLHLSFKIVSIWFNTLITKSSFRRHLALQKLDPDHTNDDDNFLRKFHRNSKHEITAAEWAICDESQEYCAIATSQLIEVVTWRSGDPNLIHSLRARTRVITDIDWHSKTPYLLASCSIDTFTHLWWLHAFNFASI